MKLNVTKTFNLGPLKIEIGEFDLKKWALVAGSGYIACSGGRPITHLTERQFTSCYDKGIKAAATAFGWKGDGAEPDAKF